MIHLQRAKLGVASERAKEDFGDLRDVGGELVVTLELDPKHVDLLKNACGLYTRDNYAETLLNAGGSHSIQISHDAAGIRCSRHPSVRFCRQENCETHGEVHCWRVDSTETRCETHPWPQS